jgi:hypothetical protein
VRPVVRRRKASQGREPRQSPSWITAGLSEREGALGSFDASGTVARVGGKQPSRESRESWVGVSSRGESRRVTRAHRHVPCAYSGARAFVLSMPTGATL